MVPRIDINVLCMLHSSRELELWDKEELTILSRDWVKSGRVEKSAVIPMRIGLTQTNLETGYDRLMEV